MKTRNRPGVTGATPQVQPTREAPSNPALPSRARTAIGAIFQTSDLVMARINKWLELADTTLEKEDEAEEEAQSTRGKRKKSA